MYGERYREAKAFWNENFVDSSTGMTKDAEGFPNDTQCAYALGLAYNMFDDKYRNQAFKHLARKTAEKGDLIGTGFFGTGLINPMLSEGGYTDIAYKLLLQTKYPSWLYPVTQGATTVWERWNSYTEENGFGGNNSMNSFNHYSLGSVLSWIYETVIGIQRDEENPGFHHFSLKPAMMVLDSASGGFETSYGRINSEWEKQLDGGYLYKCDIPCNTSATVTIMLSGKTYKQEFGSGHYEFVCHNDGEIELKGEADI
jgi:alpha-L-rhamnosidase